MASRGIVFGSDGRAIGSWYWAGATRPPLALPAPPGAIVVTFVEDLTDDAFDQLTSRLHELDRRGLDEGVIAGEVQAPSDAVPEGMKLVYSPGAGQFILRPSRGIS